MPSLHPRCAQHGLAVGPDGLCVLCKREAGGYTQPLAAAEPEPTGGTTKYIAIAAVVLLTAAGLAAALKLAAVSSRQSQPLAAVVKVPEADEPRELSAAEQSALDRAKAVDLAASLKLLEEAEAKHKAEQQLAAAELADQRKAVQAAQHKEQLERDRARHESVTRQLDEQAFRKRRGDVRITMYSTEWCGVCKRARAYMHKENIPFTEHDIEHDDSARQKAHTLNPRNSVPTITIDKELLIGFSPEALEERISRAALAYKL